MNYGLVTTPSCQTNDCLVLGLFGDVPLIEALQSFDRNEREGIMRLFSQLKQEGDSLWQTEINNHQLLLLHCGQQANFKSANLTKRLTDIGTALIKQKITRAIICLPQINDQDANWQVETMLRQLDAQLYQLTDFKTQNIKPRVLETIHFYLANATDAAIKNGQAIAEGVALTRRLADLPANICTPSYLAEQALTLAKQHAKLQVKIMEPDEIKALEMGALLAVASGSIEPARFIELQYRAGGDAPAIVLVGKGITFDSGGLSLKPPNMMDEMKYDMAGAAAVLGTMHACASLQLPLNLIGLIPSTENLPSGSATKPGDIVKSMSGQTIEIINTDAEGRLILADALTYAERFNPQWVIDLATLTGAIIVALGPKITGLMTEDDELASLILQAAKASDDQTWRLPLNDTYQDALDSPLADMINAAFDRSASALVAACFLSRYTKKYRWAHLDIAGTAWISGKNRQATGRPVPLLVEFLRHAVNSR